MKLKNKPIPEWRWRDMGHNEIISLVDHHGSHEAVIIIKGFDQDLVRDIATNVRKMTRRMEFFDRLLARIGRFLGKQP